MMKYKFLYIFCILFCLQSCSEDEPLKEEPDNSKEVRIGAVVNNSLSITRSDTDIAPDGTYSLYLPIGSLNTTERSIRQYTSTDGSLRSTNPPYWDDIKAAAIPDNTCFYLVNTLDTVFTDGTVEDILWGSSIGWLASLNFTLQHSMSKLTFVLKDETLKGDVDFTNAKVALKKGLYRKVHKLDITTGKVSIGENASREEDTAVTMPVIEDNENNGTATLDIGIVPPQAFAENTELEITAGEYVYTIPLPEKMKITGEEGEGDAIALNEGEHLTITITLTEHTIEFSATLTDWNEVTDLPDIDVNRVFNISNWQELKDLMLAVNTGYTFKGMIVRLTDNIEIEDQLSLGNEEYAFEGIFDGNEKTIKGLGVTGRRNKGGFFGYAKGATIQNVILVEPLVETGDLKALGALVDKAENTTLFNCKVVQGDGVDGVVDGTDHYTGGLVGHAVGNSSFINCYTTVLVNGHGSEYVGGLVGYSEGNINHCSSQGEVHGSGSSYVGGLAGYTTSSILNCFAWGDVTGFSKVGGLVGHTDALVSYSYAEGDVTMEVGGTDCGGLLGSMGFYGEAKYCFWKASDVYGGIGSATLDSSCHSFSISAAIFGEINNDDVWDVSGDRTVFANQ